MSGEDRREEANELNEEAVKDLDSPAEDNEGVSGGLVPPIDTATVASSQRLGTTSTSTTSATNTPPRLP